MRRSRRNSLQKHYRTSKSHWANGFNVNEICRQNPFWFQLLDPRLRFVDQHWIHERSPSVAQLTVCASQMNYLVFVSKAITVFAVLFFSGILWMLPTASHGRDFRLAATPRKKILSRYLKDVERIQSGDKSSRRQARHLNFKNHTPSGKMKAQLYCRTGFLLEILDNGRIAGTKNVTSKYSKHAYETYTSTAWRRVMY